MSFMIERRVKEEVDSKHLTTDALVASRADSIESKITTIGTGDASESKQDTIISEVDSKHTTSDALVASKHVTTDSKIATVQSSVDTINLDTDAVESMLTTVQSQNTTIESKVDTVETEIASKHTTTQGDVDSKHTTTDALVGSRADTIDTQGVTNESKLDTLIAGSAGDASSSKQDTILSEIDSKHSTSDVLLASKTTTVVTEVDANESKIDTTITTVESRHTTTDTLIGSRADTTDGKVDGVEASVSALDTTVISKHGTTDDLIASRTDTIDTQGATNESKLDTILSGTGGTATASKQDTIISEVDSKHATSDVLISSVHGTTDGEIDSKHATTDTLITSKHTTSDALVTSKSTTVVTEVNANESKLNSIKGPSFVGTDSLADIKVAVDSIQNNTAFTASIVPEMEIPEAGSTDYAIAVNIYDAGGDMEDPDLQNALVKAINPSGTSRNVNLFEDPAQTNACTKVSIHTISTPSTAPTAGATYTDTNATVLTCIGMIGTTTFVASWTGGTAPVTGTLTKTGGTGDATLTSSAVDNDFVALQRLGVGRFEAFYNVPSTHAEENMRFTFSYYESDARRYYDRSSNVVDKISTATLDSVESKVVTNSSKLDTVESEIASKHTTTQGVVASKHTTTQGDVDSKHTTTDTLVASKHTTTQGEVDSKHTTTDTLVTSKATTTVSMLNTNEALISSVHGTTDGEIDSKHATTDALVASTHTTTQGEVDSKHATTDTLVASRADTIDTSLTASDSKIDTIKSSVSDAFAQFEEVVFPKTSGTITADGNDTEEIATTASQQTTYNDTSIMASRTIGQGMGTKPVRGIYVDFGWTGQMDANTGNSKWMVVAGSSATVTGAVDVTDELAETVTKATRWRSGQIKLTPMNNLPFTVMLCGKVANGADTLTCTGYAGSTVTVVHELL